MESVSSTPLSWPEPLPPPSPLRGLVILAGSSAQRLFWSKRNLLLGLIAFLPAMFAVGAIVAQAASPLLGLGDPSRLYPLLYSVFYTHVLLFFVPLLHGIGIISDEVEGKTLTCLLTRPVSRTTVLLGKIAAYSVVSIMLVGGSLVVCYAVLNFGTNGVTGLIEGANGLLRDLTVLAVGLVVYGVIFGLFGLALRRALMVGILYAVWESFVAYVPGFLHRTTVLHHLQVHSRFSTGRAWVLAMAGERTDPASASWTLLGMFLVALVLAILVFGRREYRQQGPENG